MLSQLDNIIFPDRCEVLEVTSQRFVYPIFKNGYGSLINSNFRTLHVDELCKLDTVEIFVRDPIERFISGLSSWVNFNSSLDQNTLLTIANHHLFINRHYAPQFHWLVNLRRFTTARIKINHVQNLSTITDAHLNKNKNKIQLNIDQIPKIAFYMQLDKVLTETLLGQTVEFLEIVAAIKQYHPEVYQEVIQRSLNLAKIFHD